MRHPAELVARKREDFVEKAGAAGVNMYGGIARTAAGPTRSTDGSEYEFEVRGASALDSSICNCQWKFINGDERTGCFDRAHGQKRVKRKCDLGEIYRSSRASVHARSAARLDSERRNVSPGILRSS